jgi:hypothetical protein
VQVCELAASVSLSLLSLHRAACQLLPSSQLLAFNVAIAVAAILVT